MRLALGSCASHMTPRTTNRNKVHLPDCSALAQGSRRQRPRLTPNTDCLTLTSSSSTSSSTSSDIKLPTTDGLTQPRVDSVPTPMVTPRSSSSWSATYGPCMSHTHPEHSRFMPMQAFPAPSRSKQTNLYSQLDNTRAARFPWPYPLYADIGKAGTRSARVAQPVPSPCAVGEVGQPCRGPPRGGPDAADPPTFPLGEGGGGNSALPSPR